MDDIEKIKAEIKDRIALAEKCAEAACEKNLHSALEANEMLIRQYKSILAFIDSLSEEKPSEDLEVAAEELFETIEIQEHENIFEDTFKKIFIAGAEWQKEQMMKDAVEGEIVKDITNKLAVTAKNINLDGTKFGDKVRIIIVKED